MGIAKIGKVSLDGTKIKANASKHKALSWGYTEKLEKQLKSEIASLMKKAQETDDSHKDDGMCVPEELSIRQDRLKAIQNAKVRIKERAGERYKREKADYDTKIEKRKEKEQVYWQKSKRQKTAASQL